MILKDCTTKKERKKGKLPLRDGVELNSQGCLIKNILSHKKPITPQLPQYTLGKIKNQLPVSLERILV